MYIDTLGSIVFTFLYKVSPLFPLTRKHVLRYTRDIGSKLFANLYKIIYYIIPPHTPCYLGSILFTNPYKITMLCHVNTQTRIQVFQENIVRKNKASSKYIYVSCYHLSPAVLLPPPSPRRYALTACLPATLLRGQSFPAVIDR